MRKRKVLDSETRRLLMAAWCRLRCGDDRWLEFNPSLLTIGVLMLLAMLLCGCEPARGDVLVMWGDANYLVSPATDPLVLEIGQDLAGPGNPLGWIEFRSTRERGPEVITGSWSDAFGTEIGTQTIRIYATAAGTAVLAANGAEILDADQLSDWVALWDGSTEFHSGLNYVLFDWSSQLAPVGGSTFGQRYSGRGWVSIDEIVTEYAAAGANDKPSFIVRQWALSTDMRLAGQLLQAVPEPSSYAAAVAVCAIVVWRMRR